MPDPIPMERPKLADHTTNPPEVRERAQALAARLNRINRVLVSPAALPERRREARDDLILLAREALDLWSLI